MSLDQLEAFVYTAHLKSTNKAAKFLFLSQPTVTARIQTLEKEVNRALFDRQGKSLSLNEYGQGFLTTAQHILQIYRDGKEQLQKEVAKEQLNIGVNQISSQYINPNAIQACKDSALQCHIQSTTNDVLVAKLLNHEIDIAIMRASSSDRIEQKLITQNKIDLYVNPKHPFAKKELVHLSDFEHESVVFFECDAVEWKLVYQIFEASYVELGKKYFVDNHEVAKTFIKSEKAIGFLPEICIQSELEQGELVRVEVEAFPLLFQPIYFSTLKGKNYETVLDVSKIFRSQ